MKRQSLYAPLLKPRVPIPLPLSPRPKKQDIKHKHIWLPLSTSFLSVSLVVARSMMSLNTKHSYKLYVKRATRTIRRQQQQRRTTTPSICKPRRSFKPMKSKLSQKLQALNNLISPHGGDIVKPDQLFQETADYIVLLRTRVVVLQKLVEFYGNNPGNENALLL